MPPAASARAQSRVRSVSLIPSRILAVKGMLSGTTRPDAVTNAFTTPGESKSSGHTLTATFELNEQMNLKSITAYRKKSEYGPAQVRINGLTESGQKLPYMIEKESSLVVDGRALPADRLFVADSLYGAVYGKASVR